MVDLVRREPTAVAKLKMVMNEESVREQFKNALAEGSSLFISSLIEVFTGDSSLQACNPNQVVMEALKAATLKLPINKALGFSYLVAFDGKPTLIVGYKGYVQLAIRSGQYRFLNAGPVPEGMKISHDFLTGEVTFSGSETGDPVGYFAHLELLNGFKKTLYWTNEQILAHARRYCSRSLAKPKSAWNTNLNEMATKSMLRQLLGKWGILSVEMIAAMNADGDFDQTPEEQLESKVQYALLTAETLDTKSPDEDVEGLEEELKPAF